MFEYFDHSGIKKIHQFQIPGRRSQPLSFAKNASAGIALRCRAFVTVMQAAKVRNLDDRSDTRDLQNMRTLLVES
jgi:hypothetical protein